MKPRHLLFCAALAAAPYAAAQDTALARGLDLRLPDLRALERPIPYARDEAVPD